MEKHLLFAALFFLFFTSNELFSQQELSSPPCPPATAVAINEIDRCLNGNTDYSIKLNATCPGAAGIGSVVGSVGAAPSISGSTIKIDNIPFDNTPIDITINFTMSVPPPASCPYTKTFSASSVVTVSSTKGTSFCQGMTTTLSLSQAVGAVSYQWLRNGSPIGGATSSTYQANQSGDYTATWKLYANGCTSNSPTFTITVNPNPTAAIDAQNVCLNNELDLAEIGSGGETWKWAGPNGFNSTSQNPSIASATAAATGTYFVTATDANNCSAIASKSITIYPLPTAAIAYGKTCEDEPLTFSGTSSGGTAPLLWEWSGPNGFSDLAQNPSIFFPSSNESGVYSLTVTDANGCTASKSTPTITIFPKPMVEIVRLMGECQNQSAQFVENSGNTYSSYQWSGPNGAMPTGKSPTFLPPFQPTETFSITVTDGHNCTASETQNFDFNPKPTADFSFTSTGLTVDFFGSNSFFADSYAWTFDDIASGLANSSQLANPSHTFSTSGTYQVCLTAYGCGNDKLCQEVVVTSGSTSAADSIAPCIEWDKTIGGTAVEDLTSFLILKDGNYLVGGSSDSPIGGDKTQNSKGKKDFWIAKISKTDGSKMWDKTFGGNDDDLLGAFLETSDGGFLLAGTSSTAIINGDKSELGKGGSDFWVIKLDALLNKTWDKTFGGSSVETLYSVVETTDGYLLGGSSTSGIGGNKTASNKGLADFWVVKIDKNGSKIWDRTFGGDKDDVLSVLRSTSNGGFILGGTSNSNLSSDKTEINRGDKDFWVVKLDASGNQTWDKTIGGSKADLLFDVQETANGKFILGGYSISNVGFEKSQPSYGTNGSNDFWVALLSADGKTVDWDKTIGGSKDDAIRSIQQTADGGFVLGGYSDSDNTFDKKQNSNGVTDFWLVKISASHDILWQKTIGGSLNDEARVLQKTSNGGFVVAGISKSNKSGDKSENSKSGSNDNDFWIVKLKSCSAPPSCSTIVKNTNDSGLDSFRAAIACAESNPGADTITFQIAGAGPHIIALQSEVSTSQNDGLVIDATT